jgi:phage terminase large subunit-like protein
VQGSQEPRIFTSPTFHSSAGQEAVELAAAVGLQLDPWQQLVLRHGMGERPDGSWSSFEVCVNVPRQNGKGAIIEARQLAGLFLLNERLIIHSAHEFKTTMEAMRRLRDIIDGSDMLRRRVAHIRTTTGQECIELKTGQRLRFMARSKGAGRGFTADCTILDEAMILGDAEIAAIQPTMAAIKNPQMWYLGSAGIGHLSMQLARLRRRALAGGDDSLTYCEWSADPHIDECPTGCDQHDDPSAVETWARANPAMGIRVSPDHIQRERLSMSPSVFNIERLGVGDYPSDGSDAWLVIPEDAWRNLADPSSQPGDDLVFAIDTTPDRSWSAIGVAGDGINGHTHLEVIDHQPGTAWVVDRMAELHERWRPRAVVVDQGGPAGSLIPELTKKGITTTAPRVRDIAGACGQFYDAVVSQSVVHNDQSPLTAALAGAERRPLGDSWAWARRNTSVDISPLMAVTLAMWGLKTHTEEEVATPWVAFG